MKEDKTLDKTITIRVNGKKLEQFKQACGGRLYQKVMRNLMQRYIEDFLIEKNKRILKDKSINVDFLTK